MDECLPPATKLGQRYVFTGVCHSVNRGGRGVCLIACWDTPPRSRPAQEQTPPGSRHTPGADTPWSRHPPEQTPPGADTPPVADTPWRRHPPEQTCPPRADMPPRADTSPEQPPQSRHPPEQTCPPGSRHPPGADTPPSPRSRHPPPPRADTPPHGEHAGRYGQRAGSTHPTGMQYCIKKLFALIDLSTDVREQWITNTNFETNKISKLNNMNGHSVPR